MKAIKTIDEFILEKQNSFPNATGELTSILGSIKLAAQIVNRELNKAGLADLMGAVGEQNVQGEEQQKLDAYANEKFKAAIEARDQICGIASEEEDTIVVFKKDLNRSAKYVLLMDPLDGSSNIDVNVCVGTIFSIYERISEVGSDAIVEDFLQPGSKQVAAGYIVYGSSTMIVYTTGDGVHGFTFDPSIGVFCLSHENITTPESGNIYSINEGNYLRFPEGVKEYLKFCQDINEKENRPYASRYTGSLVSDIHRNLLKGGIYMYPSFAGYPNGKLRLIYECNPIAFLVEQAGGMATTGDTRVLDVIPTELHQRVPFFAGSSVMVKRLEHNLKELS